MMYTVQYMYTFPLSSVCFTYDVNGTMLECLFYVLDPQAEGKVVKKLVKMIPNKNEVTNSCAHVHVWYFSTTYPLP